MIIERVRNYLPFESAAAAASRPTSGPARRITHRTRGQKHGPITRLVSPSDVGELTKPFVFLDLVDMEEKSAPQFGWHPHSGIATLTVLLEGGFSYEDSTGASGTMNHGSVEWMQAGGGVWHKGKGIGQRIKGFQLWVALPPGLENGSALSQYLEQASFPEVGPARVILGRLGNMSSPILAPSPMNYLDVRLKAGQSWRYDPPKGYDVTWIAVHHGTALAGESISAGELAVFEESEASITFQAEGDAGFMLGSARKHPYDLVLGYYSVHTNDHALSQGESNIRHIRTQLQRAGKL
jgi:redox-sensitive bicupin YhaK (pirin superfamily)